MFIRHIWLFSTYHLICIQPRIGDRVLGFSKLFPDRPYQVQWGHVSSSLFSFGTNNQLAAIITCSPAWAFRVDRDEFEDFHHQCPKSWTICTIWAKWQFIRGFSVFILDQTWTRLGPKWIEFSLLGFYCELNTFISRFISLTSLQKRLSWNLNCTPFKRLSERRSRCDGIGLSHSQKQRRIFDQFHLRWNYQANR